MKSTIRILAAGLLVISVFAKAQQPPPPNPQNPPNLGAVIKSTLSLPDQQVQQLTDLRNTFQQRLQGVRDQLRTLDEQKQTLLQAANPDATQLANLLVQEQNLRRQTQTVAQSFRDSAVTLLTGDQKQKLAQIVEALKLAAQAGPLAAFGLIEGPPGPEFGMRTFVRRIGPDEVIGGPPPGPFGPPPFAPGGPPPIGAPRP